MPGNLDRQSIFGSYPGRGFLGGALTSSNKSVPAKTVCNRQTITPPWGAEGCRLLKPILVPTRVGEISAYMGLVLPPAEMPRPISYPGWENLGRGMSGLLLLTTHIITTTSHQPSTITIKLDESIANEVFHHQVQYGCQRRDRVILTHGSIVSAFLGIGRCRLQVDVMASQIVGREMRVIKFIFLWVSLSTTCGNIQCLHSVS